jgi:hypothetical protein
MSLSGVLVFRAPLADVLVFRAPVLADLLVFRAPVLADLLVFRAPVLADLLVFRAPVLADLLAFFVPVVLAIEVLSGRRYPRGRIRVARGAPLAVDAQCSHPAAQLIAPGPGTRPDAWPCRSHGPETSPPADSTTRGTPPGAGALSHASAMMHA